MNSNERWRDKESDLFFISGLIYPLAAKQNKNMNNFKGGQFESYEKKELVKTVILL